VSRERLKALAGDKLSELAKTDELELVYLHLQSLRNFAGFGEKLASHTPAAASASGPWLSSPSAGPRPAARPSLDRAAHRASPRRPIIAASFWTGAARWTMPSGFR